MRKGKEKSSRKNGKTFLSNLTSEFLFFGDEVALLRRENRRLEMP